MSTATLPDRLRALADFIETHNLPEPYLTFGRSASAHFDSVNEVCAWADVVGRDVQVTHVTEGGTPFTSYSVPVELPGWDYFTAVFHDLKAEVPA